MAAEKALRGSDVAKPLCWRETDARRLNEILNDPDVRPDVADIPESDEPLDLSKGVENPFNVNLVGEFGACFFLAVGPGTYEVHTQIIKAGRGPWAFAFTKACVDWMFTQTGAFEITTRIPKGHDGARMLAVKTGMRHEFTRNDCCTFRGQPSPVDIYSFRIQDWAPKCSAFDAVGEMFHVKLNAKVTDNGVTDAPHEDDANHNRYLGIALEMIRHGQPNKAVGFMNRWCIASRHQVVRLIGLSPVTIKFDAGTLVFNRRDFEVIP